MHTLGYEYVHFWLSDPFDSLRPIPVSLDSHDDRFRATRSHRSGTIGIIEESKAHCHDLCLHLANSWEYVGVNRIRHTISLVRSHDDLLHVVTAIW